MRWFRFSTPIIKRRRLIVEHIGHSTGGVWFEMIWQGKHGQKSLVKFRTSESESQI